MKTVDAVGIELKEEEQPRITLFVGSNRKLEKYQFPQAPDGVTVKGDGNNDINLESLDNLKGCDVALIYAHGDVEGRGNVDTETATMNIIKGFKYTIDSVRAINAKAHPKHWDIIGCYAGAFYHDIEREIKTRPETFPIGTTFSLLSSSKHAASDTGCIDYVERRLQQYRNGRSDYPSLFAQESLRTAETQYYIKVVDGGIIAFKAIAPKNIEDITNLEAFLRKDDIYAHPDKSHQRSHLVSMAGMDHPEYQTIHDEIQQSMNQGIDAMKMADDSKLDPEKTIDYRFRALHLNSRFNIKPELAREWIRQDIIDKKEKQTLLLHKLIGNVKNPSLLLDCVHGLQHSLKDIGQSTDSLDINARNIYGNTALHLASAIDMRKWHRSDITLKYADDSMMREEAWEPGYMVVVNALLEAQDIDVNLQNDFGNTPAHLAAAMLNERCLRRLIKEGARLDIRNSNGKTPLQVFEETYSHEPPPSIDPLLLDKAKKVLSKSKYNVNASLMEILLLNKVKEATKDDEVGQDMTLDQARTIAKDYILASKIENIRKQLLLPSQKQIKAAEQFSAAAASEESEKGGIFSSKIKHEELNKPSVKELAKLFGSSISKPITKVVIPKKNIADTIDAQKEETPQEPPMTSSVLHSTHQIEYSELGIDGMKLHGLVAAPGKEVKKVDGAPRSTPKAQSSVASSTRVSSRS